RRNYSIAGQKHALPDPETVSLNEAARICGVSHRTIERLVEAGLLKREQVTARAPWRIRRTDLNDKPVRSVIERLLRTGKLVLQGGSSENQLSYLLKKKEMIMPGIMSEGSGAGSVPKCAGWLSHRSRLRDASDRMRSRATFERW